MHGAEAEPDRNGEALRIGRHGAPGRPHEAVRLFEAEHQVDVLDRLAGGPLDQVVDRRERDGDAALADRRRRPATRGWFRRRMQRTSSGVWRARRNGLPATKRSIAAARVGGVLPGVEPAVDGRQDAAPRRQKVRRERHRASAGRPATGPLDLRRVLVAQHAVGAKVAVDLGERELLGRLAARRRSCRSWRRRSSRPAR